MNLVKRCVRVIPALAILVVLAGPTRGQQGGVKERFVGTWKLLLLEQRKSDGEVSYPMGRDVVGWIMYDGNGHMCVEIMRPNRPRFSSDDFWGGTPEEKKTAYEGYVAYCGTYDVNEGEGTITHHVQMSLFPNWIGTDQKRFFQFSGDRLTLSTPPILLGEQEQTARLVWERLR